MKRPWAALSLVLALSVIMPRHADAQDKKTSKPVLGLNYPNPFNPQTFIPFQVGGYPDCPEAGKTYKTSITIYNVIGQVVAIPVLRGSAGGVSGATPLDHVSLPCGEYTAWWDGKVRSNGREAASGVYTILLEQDGVPVLRKAIVAK